MKRTFVAMVVLAGLVLMASPGGAKKKPRICDKFGEGTGHYMYLQRESSMFEALDKKYADRVEELLIEAANNVIKEDAGSATDLRADKYKLPPDKAVRDMMGGMSVSFKKDIAKKAEEEGLGFVVQVYAYTTKAGGGDRRMEIELSDKTGTIEVFDYFFMTAYLVRADNNHTTDKTVERQFSYQDWFFEKYPKAKSGKEGSLPPGVDYYSSAQYRVFLEESLDELFDEMRDYKKLSECDD